MFRQYSVQLERVIEAETKEAWNKIVQKELYKQREPKEKMQKTRSNKLLKGWENKSL